jgi:SET domain-containing protein
MDDLHPSKKIVLASSKIPHAGRGVFASQAIHKGEIIEVCPVIVVSPNDVVHLKQTDLHNYYFSWGIKKETVAITLGFGSLYNHSYTPNAQYKKKEQEHLVEFSALRNINIGEEITTNYNGDPSDQSTLWMKDVPAYEKNSRAR